MLIVVKYGGNAMDPGGADPVLEDCAKLQREGHSLVLVHGGGPRVDAAVNLRGLPQRRIRGLRVTDAATLEVTEAVLCGTLNKELVRALDALGATPVGISGQDGRLLRTRPLVLGEGDLGFVGEIEAVDVAVLRGLLAGGFLPVVAPLGSGGAPLQAYNVNADTAAGAIAAALGAEAYVVVTNVERVREAPQDPASGIASLEAGRAEELLAAGAFADGMEPKIRSALHALEGGVSQIVLCGGGAGAIRRGLAGEGTTIWKRISRSEGRSR